MHLLLAPLGAGVVLVEAGEVAIVPLVQRLAGQRLHALLPHLAEHQRQGALGAREERGEGDVERQAFGLQERARTLPYYNQEILPRVLRGETTIVTAHGNSLRALIMVLEKLSPEGIMKREVLTGVPMVYRMRADSTVEDRRDLAV